MIAPRAELILPAIRWDPARGYEGSRDAIDRALALHVGGFILFGGTVAATGALTTELRTRSATPLLIASDLERGAGQQFEGATGMPPLAALASLGDLDVIRGAARITAREAAALGINWVLGPVCDLDIVPENPIVGSRAFGGDPRLVSEMAVEWVDACQAVGVLACAKHFPGHGRTVRDSHSELPDVTATAPELLETDVAPFRAAIDAGVAAVMTAHVAYPAFDRAGLPATLSSAMLRGLLREQLGFDGLVVTDALIMEGVLAGQGEGEACVRALEAGCDLLLYPTDLKGVVTAIEHAAHEGRLQAERLHASVQRRLRWAQWANPDASREMDWSAHRVWATRVAARVITVARGRPPAITSPLDIIEIDDDLGGPYPPPSRQPFVDALRHLGADARRLDTPSGDGRRSVVIALFGDVRGWKRRAGYAADTRLRLEAACAAAPDAVVVQFGHPRLVAELGGCATIVSAWGGEAVMQEAAAAWLLGRR